jgi:hypothetical protein
VAIGARVGPQQIDLILLQAKLLDRTTARNTSDRCSGTLMPGV